MYSNIESCLCLEKDERTHTVALYICIFPTKVNCDVHDLARGSMMIYFFNKFISMKWEDTFEKYHN